MIVTARCSEPPSPADTLRPIPFLTALLEATDVLHALIASSSPAALAALDRGFDDPLVLSKAHYVVRFALGYLSSFPTSAIVVKANPSTPATSPLMLLRYALNRFHDAHDANNGEPGLWDVILYAEMARALTKEVEMRAEEGAGIEETAGPVAWAVSKGMKGLDAIRDARDDAPSGGYGRWIGAFRGQLKLAAGNFVMLQDVKELGNKEERRGYALCTHGWMEEMDMEHARRLEDSKMEEALGRLALKEQTAQDERDTRIHNQRTSLSCSDWSLADSVPVLRDFNTIFKRILALPPAERRSQLELVHPSPLLLT